MTWSPSGELAVATARDFERRVLPHLRLHWPELVQAPPMRGWDTKGADLLTDPSRRPIECVVQCKGFEVEQVGDDQFRQIRDSIHKYRDSGITCDTYLVVHNRDHRDRSFPARIEPLLQELCDLGKAQRAEIWSRQEIVKKSKEVIRDRIDAALRVRSRQLLERVSDVFDGHGDWIMSVPCAEQTLRFRRFEPCDITPLSAYESRDVRDIVLSTANTRWTMLTGHFGIGKTTAALLAATHDRKTVIFVECSGLQIEALGGGTNGVMKEVLKSLGLFDSDTADDRRLYEFLAGRTLTQILKAQSDEYILIFDALDENRFYSRLRGLHLLSNQLAEFDCPIVLITRREHFDETFGDSSSALYEWSVKNAPKREAKVVDLGLWETADVCAFLRNTLDGLNQAAAARVSHLICVVEDGTYRRYYSELPRQPLFLQFILSDVIERGIHESSRSTLLSRWVARKIRRDRLPYRLSPGGEVDTSEFVRRMLLLMEEVAGRMVDSEAGNAALVESIGETAVMSLVRTHFDGPDDSILGVILNSVLVPTGVRTETEELRVRFLHRVFQEVFLARYVVRHGLDAPQFPLSVRTFCEELPSA